MISRGAGGSVVSVKGRCMRHEARGTGLLTALWCPAPQPLPTRASLVPLPGLLVGFIVFSLFFMGACPSSHFLSPLGVAPWPSSCSLLCPFGTYGAPLVSATTACDRSDLQDTPRSLPGCQAFLPTQPRASLTWHCSRSVPGATHTKALWPQGPC